MLKINLTKADPLVAFANVTAYEPSRRGLGLLRVSAAWQERFSETTAFRACQTAGVEIRFRAHTQHIEIELTSINYIGLYAMVALYHGDRALTVRSLSAQFKGKVVLYSADQAADSDTDEPWRILLPYGARVWVKALYLSDGAEVQSAAPRAVRWLAHGDSITQGAMAQSPGMTYVARVADQLGWDGLNLGFGGSAWGDAPVAEYIAGRDDWDVLSIAIGTNSYRGEIESADDFCRTYGRFVDIVRAQHPQASILCITPIWRAQDAGAVRNRYGDTINDYREAIAAVVQARAGDQQLHLLDGLSLIGEDHGLVLDRVHPDDHGMARMARGIVRAWRAIMPSRTDICNVGASEHV